MRLSVPIEAYVVCPYPKRDRRGRVASLNNAGYISLDKGLYRSSVGFEISFLLDLVLSLEPQKGEIVIGRLDAYQNEEFLQSLDQTRLEELHVIESGDWKNVPRWKRILSIVMADFTVPWIFFRTIDFKYLAELMQKYWYCYGGAWAFFPRLGRFDIEDWRAIKNSMKYDLYPLLSEKSCLFPFGLHVVDDYRIDIWFPSSRLTQILTHVESVSAQHGVQLSKTFAEI